MSRRVPFDHVSALVARLPWWAGVLAAIAAYGIIHPIATLGPVAPPGNANVTVTAFGHLLAEIAAVAQYLLPLVLLCAAAGSVWLRHGQRDDPGAKPSIAEPPVPDSLPQAERAGDPREHALGAALTALIRAETTPEGTSAAAPVSAPREQPPQAPRPVRIRPRLPLGRILNLVGMGTALGVAWAAYTWFSALPPAPRGGPWEAPKVQGDMPPATKQTQLTTGTVAATRPLGRFEFGVPLPDPSAAEASSEEATAPEEEPIEIYRSVQELEIAFGAKYIPPPECADLSSPARLASCGNHRIRARRAFIESGGRTMDPTPPAPAPVAQTQWQDADTGWPPQTADRYVDGEQTNPWDTDLEWEYRQRTDLDWKYRQESVAVPSWQTAREAPAQPAWETKPGWVGPDRQPTREWAAPGEWKPRLEPLDDEAPRAQPASRFEQDWPPQVRRQPVESWQPRFDPDARFEQAPPADDPASEDARWQQEWLRQPQPAGPQDWRSQ
jgi:hypothetical protein